MIDYIVKYQNNHISSFLFLKIMTPLFENGVRLSDLFKSNVFVIDIDYD